MVLTTAEAIEDQANRRFQGDVRRVLNVVKLGVVCRGAKEAAGFCRKLRHHPRVRFFLCVCFFAD